MEFEEKKTLIGMMRTQGNPGPLASAMAMAAKSQNASLVFFLPEDVDLNGRRISGKWFNATKWEEINCRFPDVIENDERCTTKKYSAIWTELTKNAPFTTHRLGGKPEVFQRLRKEKYFIPMIIPQVLPLSDHDVHEALETFGEIILKPAFGAKGQNIWKLSLSSRGIEIRSSEFRGQKMVNTTSGILDEIAHGQQFVIQKYIDSRLPAGNAFDVRLHVRRNGIGRWQTIKIYTRIGNMNSITSNLSSGGSIGEPGPLLKSVFGNRGEQIMKRLRSIAKEAPEKFQKLNPDFMIDALGIDLGIDRKGCPWLFEINSFPGAKYFESSDAIQRVAYCLHLRDKCHRGFSKPVKDQISVGTSFDQPNIENLACVETVVRNAWHNTLSDSDTDETRTSVYVALRGDGVRISDTWVTDKGRRTAIESAVNAALKKCAPQKHPDAIELCIVGKKENVAWRDRNKKFNNLLRGIWGIEISYKEKSLRIAPTKMIAGNHKFSQLITGFLEEAGITEKQASSQIKLARFKAEQYLVPLSDNKSSTKMFRGNQIVPQHDVTQENVTKLAKRMSGWMFNNLMPEGRMVYKYWPSSGKESTANNTIRQWMATLCLVRTAAHYRSPDMMNKASANILYNISEFFLIRDGLGSIEFGGSSKLGAIAIAALAMSEHRDPHLITGHETFNSYERVLSGTIDYLWQKDGSFRTFLVPQERNDNQNFYPGEALLYLAHKYRKLGEESIALRAWNSARYYKEWHLKNRNPAFVPWHTMAYSALLERRFDRELAEWVFEMNDWLLSMQQTAPLLYPDIDGRFYDPKRPKFGVPHASSTGVYLEGLLAAYRLAKATGDHGRSENYRKAIVRGVRSLMQLEFRDDIDTFYISKKERVLGGLRTTVYNNEIRVDNIQHGLMAILQILTEFSEDDFGLN